MSSPNQKLYCSFCETNHNSYFFISLKSCPHKMCSIQLKSIIQENYENKLALICSEKNCLQPILPSNFNEDIGKIFSKYYFKCENCKIDKQNFKKSFIDLPCNHIICLKCQKQSVSECPKCNISLSNESSSKLIDFRLNNEKYQDYLILKNKDKCIKCLRNNKIMIFLECCERNICKNCFFVYWNKTNENICPRKSCKSDLNHEIIEFLEKKLQKISSKLSFHENNLESTEINRNRKTTYIIRNKSESLDCIKCMKTFNEKNLFILDCLHIYCKKCLEEIYERKNKSFKCPENNCKKPVSALIIEKLLNDDENYCDFCLKKSCYLSSEIILFECNHKICDNCFEKITSNYISKKYEPCCSKCKDLISQEILKKHLSKEQYEKYSCNKNNKIANSNIRKKSINHQCDFCKDFCSEENLSEFDLCRTIICNNCIKKIFDNDFDPLQKQRCNCNKLHLKSQIKEFNNLNRDNNPKTNYYHVNYSNYYKNMDNYDNDIKNIKNSNYEVIFNQSKKNNLEHNKNDYFINEKEEHKKKIDENFKLLKEKYGDLMKHFRNDFIVISENIKNPTPSKYICLYCQSVFLIEKELSLHYHDKKSFI